MCVSQSRLSPLEPSLRPQARQGCAAHGRASAPESVPGGILLDLRHGRRPVRVLLDSVEQCRLLLPGPGRLLPGRHPQPTHRSGGRRGVQDGLCCRLSRDVPPTVELPLLRACLKDYFWTCAMDVGQSASCWTQSSSAIFCFQGLAVSSLADTPSQHTDPEDDGGVQDGLCCRYQDLWN
nr:uncharacterized protein LOC111771798 isoform X2 [Equus caballus]